MTAKHCTDDELIESLYGVRSESAHLGACDCCRLRLEQMRSVWQSASAPPPVPVALLAAQRHSVFERAMQRRTPLYFRALPAVATTAVVVLGLVLSAPRPKPVSGLRPQPDSQFFNEINAMAASPEPAAVAPIHNLFQE